jgi:diguanylate cyclase (GGDEF)-like protein
MIDIDKFKNINDTYGHVTGDMVLVKLSDIMRKCIRNTDFIGRYGGEEFLLIFDRASIDDSIKIVKRIMTRFRYSFNSEIQKPLTFSTGIIEVCRDRILEYSDKGIIAKADTLLYKAKEKGRNRIEAQIL